MHFRHVYHCAVLLLGLPFLSGCKWFDKDRQQPKNASADTYYSIKGFLDDQWRFLEGQPIVLLRVATFNGKSDSSFVSLDSMVWKEIRKQFDASDIGEPRFLGQYDFSMYNEEALNQIVLSYTAKNRDLLTQKINIGMDNVNHQVRTVYIETHKGNRTYEKTQKLTYIPRQVISIQAFEKSIISRPENLRVAYYFKY
ncbi:MAG TPA: hypothetical protein VFL76_09320 [Edaphocola sp.]|nr:hypothetical protein [Edaphocola sp.]